MDSDVQCSHTSSLGLISLAQLTFVIVKKKGKKNHRREKFHRHNSHDEGCLVGWYWANQTFVTFEAPVMTLKATGNFKVSLLYWCFESFDNNMTKENTTYSKNNSYVRFDSNWIWLLLSLTCFVLKWVLYLLQVFVT